ncbi:MAG: M12 family metallo-peptidase, partial [Balneolaceae bacterium]
MRKIGLYILTAAIILVASTGTKAQEKEVFKLNTIESEAIQKAKHAEKGKIYFNLNEDVFTDPEFKAGALFELSIGEEEPVQLMIRKSLEYLPGTVSIIASKKGERERVFTGTYSNGRLNGLYHESHDKAFKISYDTERNQQFLTTNNTNETLACGLHEAEERYIAFSPDFGSNNTFKAKTTSGEYEYSPAPLNASLDDSITIDLMLVYTNPAEQWASTSEHGDIDGVIAQAMSLSQTALDNSNLGIELRLVHAHKTDYDEENDGLEKSGDRLSRLTQNPDNPIFDSSEGHDGHMEEVHDLRIQYGADIVALLIKIEDTGGLGWRLGNTSGSPHYGFNLNRVQQVASNFTLIHEIGHNMGNAHARTQEEAKAETTGGLFHYSAGYQNTAENFHTIMAYADGLQEAPIFSSPDLTWEGVPAGTNNNQTPENNRLSMRQIKRTVAGYLPSIQSAPEVAVSTNEITVNMNREDEFSTTLQISNNGESGLVWNVDFDFPGNTVGKQKAVKKNFSDRIEGKFLEKPKGLPANYSARDSQFKTKQQEQVLYSSSFESNEGFGTGSFIAQSDWRTFGNSEFLISSVKPKSGSQHFRLEY